MVQCLIIKGNIIIIKYCFSLFYFSKHADLKIMLDSNRENIKMDAMKRIINVINI